MRPRVEEILEEVRAHLDAAGFEHLPSQQIVLTGGASQVPGMDTLASRILGSRCALAALCVFIVCHKPTQGPVVPLVGVSLFAAHPQDEWWDFNARAKLGARSIRKALRWFKRIGSHKLLWTWPDRATFRCFSLYFA